MSRVRTFRTGCSILTDYNWRVEADGRTNLRAVADIGTHWMDLAQFLIGSPISALFADLATFHPRRLKPAGPTGTFGSSSEATSQPLANAVEISTDDHAAVILKFDGGVRGAFHVSQVTAGRKNRLTIEIAAHQRGRLLGQRIAQPPLARFAHGGQSGSGTRPSPARSVRRLDQPLSGGHAEGFPDTFKQLFLDVYGWIVAAKEAGQPKTFPTFVDGHHEVCLCEAIAKSATIERWVTVTDNESAPGAEQATHR